MADGGPFFSGVGMGNPMFECVTHMYVREIY
jgi:hypothetical protein